MKQTLKFNVIGRYWEVYTHIYIHTYIHTSCDDGYILQGEDIDEDDFVDHSDLQIDDKDVAEMSVEVNIRYGDDVGKHILDISKLGSA